MRRLVRRRGKMGNGQDAITSAEQGNRERLGASHFRPRRLHAVHRCGLLLQTSHVAWSICVCVLGKRVSCAKTAEPIEMPFGGWLMRVQRTMYWMRSRSPHGKGHFWGDMWRPTVTHLRMSALCLDRLPPRVNVPAQRTRRTNAFAAARVTIQQCGLLPHYIGHFLPAFLRNSWMNFQGILEWFSKKSTKFRLWSHRSKIGCSVPILIRSSVSIEETTWDIDMISLCGAHPVVSEYGNC